MLCDEPIGPKEPHGPLAVDEWHEHIADGTLPRVRTFLGAMLFGAVCACGGGGGYSSSSGGSNNPPPPSTNAPLLYVANESAGSIDALTIDTKTGIPTPISGSPLPDGPMPSAIAVDPQKRYLYAVSPSGEVRGYLLDASTGKLTAMSGSPFLTSAPSVAIAVDPGGRFVLTANGTSSTVSVFKIGSTGGLTEVGGSPFAAGADPVAIIVASQYVYAANKGGASVSAYSMDMTSGTLAPVSGSPFPAGANPQALVVDPAGTHLYTADSQPSAVSGFNIDVSTGALSAIAGSPFPTPNGAWSVVMDAAGKLLHVADGTNVYCYAADPGSGALTALGPSITNGRAIALAVDGPDNFLYALDNVDNQVEVFSIDYTSGSLKLIAGNPFPLFSGSSSQSLGPTSIIVAH